MRLADVVRIPFIANTVRCSPLCLPSGGPDPGLCVSRLAALRRFAPLCAALRASVPLPYNPGPALPAQGGQALDLSESPTDPLGGGGGTLDSQKEQIQGDGGGWYKVTLV